MIKKNHEARLETLKLAINSFAGHIVVTGYHNSHHFLQQPKFKHRQGNSIIVLFGQSEAHTTKEMMEGAENLSPVLQSESAHSLIMLL